MGISANQQRSLELLLQQDIYALQSKIYQAFQKKRVEAREKAIADWHAANPKARQIQTAVEKYAKTVNKRMDKFVEEAEQAGLDLRVRKGQSWISPGYFLPDEHDRDLFATITKAEEEVRRREQEAQVALGELRQQKQREILVATLKKTDDILTMPTIDEFLAAL